MTFPSAAEDRIQGQLQFGTCFERAGMTIICDARCLLWLRVRRGSPPREAGAAQPLSVSVPNRPGRPIGPGSPIVPGVPGRVGKDARAKRPNSCKTAVLGVDGRAL